MKVNYYEKERLLIIKVNEEIDECTAKEIRRKADYEIEKYMPKEVIFDFDGVTFMDSSGIGMVIGRYKQAGLFGGKTFVSNLSSGVKKILKMSGVLKIIPEVNLEKRLENSLDKEELKEVIG